MNNKVKTTIIGSNKEYAKVADRVKFFWEQNPGGKIETERENIGDNKIRFVARIWRDSSGIIELAKSGASVEVIKMTANATASADAIKKGDKENEKLETIAVGRALAMLGYLASGEVASREEMEEFEDYKSQKYEEAIHEAIQSLDNASSIEELRKVFVTLEVKVRNNASVIAKKDECKAKLIKNNQGDQNESSPNPAK